MSTPGRALISPVMPVCFTTDFGPSHLCPLVIPVLDTGIHPFVFLDAQITPGHDEKGRNCRR